MKIMDISDGDEECQIEAVISSKGKKTKQARLPFQTLSSDSPVANKKRKSLASPEVRSAKQPKVNTKENSFKTLKETATKDITEEKIIDKEETTAIESDRMKDNSKQVTTTETQDSKSKKTPGKGSTKSKKSEPKIQSTSLTQFFKKIDNKDNKEAKNETQTTSSINKEKETEKKSNKDEEAKVSKKSNDQKDQNTEQNKSVKEESKKSSTDDEKVNKNIEKSTAKATNQDKESDSENKKEDKQLRDDNLNDSCSSNESGQTDKDTSHLNGKMDVDSDVNLLSDDSHEDNEGDDDEDDGDDDDSGKSDTDNKRTEHEDTDSRDDTHKNSETQSLTPVRNKLLNSSTKSKKLTPKQLEKKLEMQKKREMREKQRLEREKKLQEERESRKREKEEKRKEREEKEKTLKEQKKKEKELKELKRQAELEQKQKEKEAKEEDRRKREEAKEEEKRRKEEERLEAERKKQKTASHFAKFFVPIKPTDSKPAEDEGKVEVSRFMPFEIKADMKVAPSVRRNWTENEKSKLDELIKSSDVNKSELYISELRDKKFDARKSGKTWPLEANDDVIILEDEDEDTSSVVQPGNIRQKLRPKLLMFAENRRPPYWGTWRKKSRAVNPRRPFGKDTEHFDYEVDSDDEWEEEEPGESLRGSDDEKEEEPNEENEYDVDNDFMVPHGYLSEEEILGADEEDEDEEDINPEEQKTKLKILGEQFEAERNTKTKKLKPKVVGCIWLNKDNAYPETISAHTIQFLTLRQAWVREIPVSLTAPADTDNLNDTECGNLLSKQNLASSMRKAKAMEEAMPALIRLLHGNTNRQGFLLKEFVEYLSRKKEGQKLIPKSKLRQRIRDVATWMPCPEPGPMQDKSCWYVTEALRKQYLGDEKLPLPNQWTYCLPPKKKNVNVDATDKPNDKEKEKEKEKEKKTVPLITQFTKTLTAEEKQKQLTEKVPSTPVTPAPKLTEKSLLSTSATKSTPPLNKPPKRATLISVPRGEPIPKSPRMSLMDKFVTKDNPLLDDNSKKDNKLKKGDTDDEDDDCMLIDVTDVTDEKVESTSKIDSAPQINKSPNKDSNDDADMSMKSVEDADKSQNVSTSSEVDVIEI